MTSFADLLSEADDQMEALARRHVRLTAVKEALSALEKQGVTVEAEGATRDGREGLILFVPLPPGPVLRLPAPAPEAFDDDPGEVGADIEVVDVDEPPEAEPADGAAEPTDEALPEAPAGDPLIPDRVGNLVDPNLAGVPWSDEEKAQAREILRGGGTVGDVGAALRRQYDNAAKNCRAIREELDAAAAKASASRAPKPSPAAPASDHQVKLSAIEQRDFDRLCKLTRTALWVPESDLVMFEMLASGVKAQDAATVLETTRAEVVDRFHAICPEPTPANQERIVRLLRLRVAAQRGVAA